MPGARFREPGCPPEGIRVFIEALTESVRHGWLDASGRVARNRVARPGRPCHDGRYMTTQSNAYDETTAADLDLTQDAVLDDEDEWPAGRAPPPAKPDGR